MRRIRLQRSVLPALVAIVTLTPALVSEGTHAQFQTGPTLFSGHATALKGQLLGIPIDPVSTGSISPEGGTLQAHLVCYPNGPDCTFGLPDLTDGAVEAQVLNATVVAQGSHSRARASVADLSLKVLGQTISATLIEARASAQCSGGQASVAAVSELVHLTINNQPIVVAGGVTQKIDLPAVGGFVLINEQIGTVNGGTGNVTVRALHIVIPGVPGTNTDTDIVIAEAHADIVCGQRFCPVDRDFVTGGGFLGNPRKNFAVAGGFKNGAFWGHLMFIDHGSRRRVKGTGVTGYGPVVGGPATARRIQGTFREEGQPVDGEYDVVVDDRGEPGREDSFVLLLNGEPAASGFLDGGNIQLHTCK